MNREIVGIIDVDYPEMSSDDRRKLQLGELEAMPDGKSVADYVAEVEMLKEMALMEADDERNGVLAAQANSQETTQEKEEAGEPSITVDDEDLVFEAALDDDLADSEDM